MRALKYSTHAQEETNAELCPNMSLDRIYWANTPRKTQERRQKDDGEVDVYLLSDMTTSAGRPDTIVFVINDHKPDDLYTIRERGVYVEAVVPYSVHTRRPQSSSVMRPVTRLYFCVR
ncbi:unnamed protein product [Peniophora sp. CBMAI 1063]|nr:unnamed protein product [Peniophora sp. CBMAI 1063]